MQRSLRAFRRLASTVALVILANVAVQAAVGPAHARAPLPRPAGKVQSVVGSIFTGSAAGADPTVALNMRQPKTVQWPTTGSARVALPGVDPALSAPTARAKPVKVGVWPIAVGAVRGTRDVRVEVVRSGAADGLLLSLSDQDLAHTGGRVAVSVGYGGFQDAYGGAWADRLSLVRVPECALLAPEAPACQPHPLPTVRDAATKTLSADVDIAAAPSGMAASTSAVQPATLVALTAGPASDGGSYAATGLQPSSTWSAGGQSGGFEWSYPMRVPPGLNGPEPQLGVFYASQSLDGKTAATNNQPSWVGDGFDMPFGSIERSYKSCVDDGVTTSGDLCWGTDNATLSMPGHTGELIQVSTTPDVWRLQQDDGSKVERLVNTVNGDNDNEYWKVTTPNGVQYFFGLNRLPGWTAGQPETGSAFTVPVFGNNAGEPCNQSTFAASWCTQAYRWNLDYVVDPTANTMSQWFTQETNHYARNKTATAVSGYVRAGHIDHVSYGTRQDLSGNDNIFGTAAPMQVVFTPEDRCVVPGTTCAASTPSNWPDVPWDQQCNSTSNCASVTTPTFFSQKRLAAVTTQVRDGSAYRDVERWTLTHVFKDPGDNRAKLLWLDKLGHEGLAGGTAATPDVTFGAVQLNNRVDTSVTKDPIIRFRISSIVTETGGVISVNYLPPECVLGSNMPVAAANTKRCYPAYSIPPGQTTPTFDWFHKYVVDSVAVADPAGGSPTQEFRYSYSSPGPMWHYDDSELTPPSHKSWGQWRGYAQVRTVAGASGSGQMQSDAVYFQGMHGDKAASGTRTVTIPADPDFGGPAINDEDWLHGQTRENIVYNGVGAAAPVVSKALFDPWTSAATATRNRNGVVTTAYLSNTRRTTTLTALDNNRGWRKTQSTNTFDTEDGTANPIGRITKVDDANDVATTADDQCTRYEYAANPGKNLLTATARAETVAVGCAATPNRAADVVSDTRNYYDGATTFGTAIDIGKLTKVEVLADWNGGSPVYKQTSRYTYDDYGRVYETFDALDRRVATSYTPAARSPSSPGPTRWAGPRTTPWIPPTAR